MSKMRIFIDTTFSKQDLYDHVLVEIKQIFQFVPEVTAITVEEVIDDV